MWEWEWPPFFLCQGPSHSFHWVNSASKSLTTALSVKLANVFSYFLVLLLQDRLLLYWFKRKEKFDGRCKSLVLFGFYFQSLQLH